jgi:hypothetical protein
VDNREKIFWRAAQAHSPDAALMVGRPCYGLTSRCVRLPNLRTLRRGSALAFNPVRIPMSQIKNDCQNKNHHHKGRYCLHRVLLIYRELLIICRPWTQSLPVLYADVSLSRGHSANNMEASKNATLASLGCCRADWVWPRVFNFISRSDTGYCLIVDNPKCVIRRYWRPPSIKLQGLQQFR